MRKHAAANDNVRGVSSLDGDVLKLAIKNWEACLAAGEKNGWRNAQASVLAPTGTIGFMMDCDTTGIEPDFSLVKFKKLVGGGSMQIVNQTIPRALRKLGYTEETIEAIVEYISENGHVIDAPGLKTEHYAIFDTAMGARSISPMGHVRMMAAVQSFISGAISKTVNMPESATIEEVEEIYYEGWKLGIKALAIYRDNCKVGQPLSDGKAAKVDAQVEAAIEGIGQPIRRRLPKSRPSRTTSFAVAGAEGYLTAGTYEDGELGEVFLKLGKQGSTPGRSHGCVLHRHLYRPAIRRAARCLCLEVREHALRAGRHDRRSGHPDQPVDHGLHLPSVGVGLPAIRQARGAGHLLRRRACGHGGDRLRGPANRSPNRRRCRLRGRLRGRLRRFSGWRSSGCCPGGSQGQQRALEC